MADDLLVGFRRFRFLGAWGDSVTIVTYLQKKQKKTTTPILDSLLNVHIVDG